MSANAWVGCGGDVYVLECLGKGHVRIEPVENEGEDGQHYRAYFNPALDSATATALKIGPFLRSRQILTAANLTDAVHGCDTYVRSKVVRGPMQLGLLRTARWRMAPATEQQKKLVAKRWGKRQFDSDLETENKAQRIAKLTKGEAANIISRLKHGAQARYDKKVKIAARTAHNLTKEVRRRAREDVRVGPLPVETN